MSFIQFHLFEYWLSHDLYTCILKPQYSLATLLDETLLLVLIIIVWLEHFIS